MAQEKNSLAIVAKGSYALAQYDEAQLREVVSINMGGEGSLTEFDLSRLKVPSGGSTVFNMTGPDGDSSPQEIVGVIVCHQNRRTYYKERYDPGNSTPPDCWSPDGVVGVGLMAEKCGGQCARCPMAQFGTAVDQNGKPTKGQACGQRKAIFIMQPDSILPIYFSLPPTSLAAFKAYLAGLIGKRLPITGVVTKITLVKKAKNAEAKFQCVGTLDAADMRKFTEFGAMFSKMFRPTIPGTDGDDAATVTVDGQPVNRATGEFVSTQPAADADGDADKPATPANAKTDDPATLPRNKVPW